MKVLVNSSDKVYLTSGTKALKAKEKCGMTIGDFIGDVVSGTLNAPPTVIEPDFSGVTDLENYALYYKFHGAYTHVQTIDFPDLVNITGNSSLSSLAQYNTNVTSVSFPELVSITGQYACQLAFASGGISSIVFPKLTTISGISACQSMLANNNLALTSVSFPELTTVSGQYTAQQCCYNCTKLTSVSLPKLTTVTGSNAMSQFVASCSVLTSFELPELVTASGDSCLTGMFNNCSSLQTVRFPKLSDISGSATFSSAFRCPALQDIYFNGLTTTSFGSYINQFNGMFNTSAMSTSGNCTIHFPSNLESTIQGLTGYPNFSATAGRLTLAYDLPATS